MRLASRLGPLADGNFARLWSARTLSLIGDYAFRIALVVYVISVTRSAAALAAVTAALLVPTLVFYLLGGVVGDRVRSRQRILVAVDIARFAATGAMALAAWLTTSVPLVVLCALVVSVGEGFFRPASFAFLTVILPKDRLVSANSANSISQQLGLIVGPLLGALLVGWLGPAAAFAFDAATFLLSAVLIAGIRLTAAPADKESITSRPPPRPGPRGVLADVAGGLTHVRKQRWLLITCLVGATANAVFTGGLGVAVPLVLAPAGTGQAGALGWFYTLEGVGALVGAFVLARLTVVRIGGLLYSMIILMALSLAAVGLLGNRPAVYTAAAAYGVGLHFFNSLYPTLLQSNVPPELLSRVSSFTMLAFHGLMPVGAALMGPLADTAGARAALIGTGLAVTAACLVTVQLPSIRTLTVPRPPLDATGPTGKGADRASAG